MVGKTSAADPEESLPGRLDNIGLNGQITQLSMEEILLPSYTPLHIWQSEMLDHLESYFGGYGFDKYSSSDSQNKTKKAFSILLGLGHQRAAFFPPRRIPSPAAAEPTVLLLLIIYRSFSLDLKCN